MQIRENLDHYASTSSKKWMLYLIDFMSAIEKLYEKNMDLDEIDQFFIDNDEHIQKIMTARLNFEKKLYARLKAVFELMKDKKPGECTNQAISNKICIYSELQLSNHRIVLDVFIKADGWSISFVGRSKDDENYLDQLFLKTELQDHKIPKQDERYMVQKIKLTSEPMEVVSTAEKWFEIILKAENELTHELGKAA